MNKQDAFLAVSGRMQSHLKMRFFTYIQLGLVVINGLFGHSTSTWVFVGFMVSLYILDQKYWPMPGTGRQKMLTFLHIWSVCSFCKIRDLQKSIEVQISLLWPAAWSVEIVAFFTVYSALTYSGLGVIVSALIAMPIAWGAMFAATWFTIGSAVYDRHVKYRSTYIDDAERMKEYYCIHMYVVTGVIFKLPDMIKYATDQSHPENLVDEVFCYRL